MHIVLLCATQRGHRFLKRLAELAPPGSELTVFSFRETPEEPPFLDGIRGLAETVRARFFETRNVAGDKFRDFWEQHPVDLMLVVNWRYILPEAIYRRSRRGCFVIHDSLLPEYRGFSPVVWAMINGETHTGATLFEIAPEFDAGPVVDQIRVPIGPADLVATVMEQVTRGYLTLLERNLTGLLDGTAPRRPQDIARATYTCRRLPEDNRINWAWPTRTIHNLIRAVSAPYPGAFTYLGGSRLRVWSARRMEPEPRYVGRMPGRIVEIRPGEGSVVLTGDGVLLLEQAQLSGGEIVCASEILNSLGQTLGP
jgi:methionyl-tRNA formyltransferase